PFSGEIAQLQFYQDPTDTAERKVVGTLQFSHPVDAATLEQHVNLGLREADQTLNDAPGSVVFDLELGPHGRVAYVHSASLTLPENETYMGLTVAAAMTPVGNSAKLDTALAQNVLIPDRASFFKVTSLQAQLVRDDNDDPVQTVSLEWSDRVSRNALARHISAYVLPVSPMIDGERQRNKYWRGPREVTPDVLGQAREIELTLNAVADDAAFLHSAAVDVPDNATLYVRVAEGLTSSGDFVLGRAHDAIVRVPAYPKEARIGQAGALLPLTGTHELTLLSRGVSTLKVDVGRVLDNDINHLASQTNGDIKSPQFSSYQFDEDNLTSRTERFVDVSSAKPSEAAFARLDMSEFLPQGGYYLVTVQGWDRGGNYPVGSRDQRLVLISDIGLLVKTNADNTHDVFVHSLSSGRPLSAARVAVLGKNGLPIIERLANSDGHATLPSTRGYQREKTPTVFVVRNGSDQIFMPFSRNGRKLQYSRFDVGGQFNWDRDDESTLRAQVFTDRGLYRPGETVELGAIVKRDNWGALGNLPIGWRVRDPRGNDVLEMRQRLPGDGLVELPFATEAGSPTGNYYASLFVVEANNRKREIGSVRFQVEEFQPDRLRIKAHIDGDAGAAWIKPQDLLCNVQLDNLFGAPAQGRRVAGFLELTPSGIRLQDFADYRFDDPLRKDGVAPARVASVLGDATTDDSGHAALALDLARYEQGVYRLGVTVEGFEAGGGRSVKTHASVMMSPLDYLVGYRSASDLGWLQRDSEHAVDLIAVDSSGEAIALQELTRSIVAYRYVSTLVKRPNGTFAYQSVRQETPLSSAPLTLPAEGVKSILPTEEPGAYAMLITDAAGRVYSKVDFTVAGARNVAGDLERDAQLTLNLNGDSFEPGEEIEMEIVAPFTGTGLITIERERVLAHHWFVADTTTSVQRIRVPNNLEGNAYVNVAFVRDLNSPEIFVSPLSYAVAPFAVNRDARTLDVTLNVPEKVRPGEALEIEYSTAADGRVLIFAVDEGILQVGDYEPPSPLDFFMRKRALQVKTYQMVDLILPEFEAFQRLAAPGGGDGAGLARGNLNPFQRRNETPVAFWSGVLDSGPQVRTTTWNVPDHFDGQVRIMAVAVNDAALGKGQASTLVRGPFVLSPNVLTAAAPGDEFEINIGVSNQLEGSGSDVAVSVTIAPTEQLEVVGEASQTLSIDEGREGRARFRLRARDVLGAAEVAIVAAAGEERAERRATLSVRPAVAYVSSLQAAVHRGQVPTLEPKRELYAAYADERIAASVSPLILADGLLDYLDAFPHACAEQMVSKVFPQVGLLGHADSALDEAAVRAAFAGVVSKLRARQTGEGGFSFWLGDDAAAEFPSVYILHFLTDAAVHDLPVPRAMRRAGMNYLQTLAAREVTSLQAARVRAYAIYVLTRNEVVTTGYLTNLHEFLDDAHADVWRADLIGSYMAASYALLKQEALATPLIRAYNFADGNETFSDFDTRLGRDAQHVYLLARHFDGEFESLDEARLQALIDPVMANRFNTLSSAYTILALGEVTRAQARSGNLPPLTLQAAGNVLADAQVFARATLASNARQIDVTGNADGAVFTALSQRGYDRLAPETALAEGLELERQYLDKNGEPVTRANIGDELTVRLRVRGLGRTRTNVAVSDLLPGGFEVLTDTVQRRFGGWQADYVDVREDRVVIYGSFGDRVAEMRYQVKATSAGRFSVPSAFAASMYDRGVQARTAPGEFEVEAL
ncbi:MAG: alpha-2-macroglobulin, partial [Gammaproteobacteria bacterium]